MSESSVNPAEKSKRPEKGVVIIYSFLVASLCFIAVVFGYQLFVGVLSYALGYDTHFYFGRIVSRPFLEEYWSNNRVVLMYAFPPLLFLFTSVFILARLLPKRTNITISVFYLYWLVVFLAFFVTTQMAVSPISLAYRDSQLYQGLPVLIYWFGWPAQVSLILFLLSLFINLLFGYFSYPLLLRLAHEGYCYEDKPWKGRVVRLYFIYPLILVLILAVILGYMYSLAYFIVMLLSSFLWGFGMWIKDMHTHRHEGMSTSKISLRIGFVLPIVILVLVVVIRLFFAK